MDTFPRSIKPDYWFYHVCVGVWNVLEITVVIWVLIIWQSVVWYLHRDVSTGVTGTAAVTPKFSDTLTISQTGINSDPVYVNDQVISQIPSWLTYASYLNILLGYFGRVLHHIITLLRVWRHFMYGMEELTQCSGWKLQLLARKKITKIRGLMSQCF